MTAVETNGRATTGRDVEHTLPHDVEAEMAVLGSMMLNHTVATSLAATLTRQDFYRDAHGDVFDVVAEIAREGRPCDVILLRERLQARGILESIGGSSTISRIWTGTPTSANGEYYARIVRDLAARRAAIEGAARVAQLARDSDDFGEVEQSARDVVATLSRVSVGEWPALRPLDAREFGEFPVHALPRDVADWAAAASVAFQVPVDLPAMVALAVLASTLIGKAEAEPRPGWREVLALWTLVTAEPGTRKSAVHGAATRSLYAYQAERQADEAIDLARAADRRKVAEDRVTHARKLLASASAEKVAVAQEAYERAREALDTTPAPRPAFRLIVDDVTPERLAAMIAEQPGERMALASAEGGFVKSADGSRYGQSGTVSLDVLLKSHAGDPFSQDRKSGSIAARRPVLVIGVVLQPEALRGLAHDHAARGLGFLARFLYAVPPNRVGTRVTRVPAVAADIDASYQALIRKLLDLPQGNSPEIIRFSGEADDAVARFQDELEPRLGPAGDLHAVADWGGKLAGAVVRIATIFACADAAREDREFARAVEAAHVARAIEVARYLIPHASAAFDVIAERPEKSIARRVLAWIERTGHRTFKAREAFQGLKGGTGSVGAMGDVAPALDLLVARGYLIESPIPQIPQNERRPGRAPSPTYRVHPAYPPELTNWGIRGIGGLGAESSPSLPLSDSGATSLRNAPPNPPRAGEAS